MAIFPCHPAKKTTVQMWDNSTWKSINPEDLNSLKLKNIPQNDVSNEKNLVFTPMKYMGGIQSILLNFQIRIRFFRFELKFLTYRLWTRVWKNGCGDDKPFK